MKVGKNTGKLLKFFREHQKKSQLEIESTVGISSGSLSRIENGSVNPTKETIQKIAVALNLNDWEMKYVLGKYNQKASIGEIAKAKEDLGHFMNSKGRLAYMVDERSRVWAVSTTFLKLFGMSENYAEYEGKSIAEFIIDQKSPAYKFIDVDNREEMLTVLFKRMYTEMYFMVDDPVYQSTLEIIKQDKLAWHIWNEVKHAHFKEVYPLEERKVVFNFWGIPVSLNFSVEPYLANERFRIVEYIPTNKIIKMFSNLFF